MQRTEQWFRQRRGKLTASAFGQATGLTPWGSPKQLAEQLKKDMLPKDLDDDPPGAPRRATTNRRADNNVAMRWGTDNEPNGLLEYAALVGAHVEPTGFWEHPTLEWIGGSPDGLVEHDGLIEVKCPYTRKCYGEVPPYYYPQINALLEITGRAYCDLFVWTPEAHRIWRIRANKQAFDELVTHYAAFWAHVVGKAPLPANPSKELLKKVRAWIAEDAHEIHTQELEPILMLRAA